MSNWFTAKNADQVDTPALLIFPDRVKENIRILQKFVPDVNRLRPHVKTNKCPQVCQLMLDAGMTRFKCATIAEAEMLGQLKANDVLLAYQPLGPKVLRLLDLIETFPSTKFSCLVDNLEAAIFLADVALKANKIVDVFIDLNVGMNRTGIRPENAQNLFQFIQQSKGLQFRGLHAYDGHLRDTDLAVRTQKCNEAFLKVKELQIEIQKQTAGHFTIIAGGTPTFPIHAQRNGVECSPGTFIFWDKGYQQVLPEQPYLFAALVLTRVISLPDEETITTDLGHKAIASENPLPNRVFFMNAPELVPTGHSEEHLVLKGDKGHPYKVGDLLYGVPYHVCPTVALYETANVVIDNMAVETWTIVSRKRKITV
jgi:D-threonine aldolase